MNETLTNALHDRLDKMGAPPREEISKPAAMPEREETPVEPPELEVVPGGKADDISTLGEIPGGGEADGDAEAGLEDEQPGGEVPERYKAADFAKAIGWEPKDLYEALEIPIGDNGETLTLGQIKDQYGDLQAQQAEVEQAKAAVQAQAEQLQKAQQQQVVGGQEQTDEIREAMGKVEAIKQQYGQVNWDKLEAENPGQAANLRQKFATAYAGANQELENVHAKAKQEREKFEQQFIAAQQARVMELVPEWKDQKTFDAENPEISAYMLSRGFTPEELPTIYHAGLRAMARDAWQWHKHKDEVKKARKKMTRKAPKQVVRPGGPPVPSVTERAVQELEAEALRTGRSSDKLAAARAIVQSLSRSR